MKIQQIQPTFFRQYSLINNRDNSLKQSSCKNLDLSNNFYYPMNINFTGQSELEGLKRLFAHGLPCMYTGVEMLDSKITLRFISCLHGFRSKTIFNFLEKWEKSFLHPAFISNSGKQSYFIIKEQAENNPDATLKEILQSLKPKYEKELIKEQLAIITTLSTLAYSLPKEYAEKYVLILENNKDRILGKPISMNFSAKEFQYKLEQIKQEFATLKDKKAVSIINALLKESKNLAPKTTEINQKGQRKTLRKLESIFYSSQLNKNESLNNLFKDADSRLNNRKTYVPFTKKGFLHDLGDLLKDMPDKDLKCKIMTITSKLPTSDTSSKSYIIKFASKTPDKFVYNLLWPIIASIEHIHPKSIGGEKYELKNCGGATALKNSKRSSIKFTKQIEENPDTAKFCQKYLDRLIKFAHNGIFEQEQVDIKYIEDFKTRIAEQSEGQIILDTSKLYEGGKFKKPEPALFN